MKVLIKSVDNEKAKHREGQIRDFSLIGVDGICHKALLNYIDGSEKECMTSEIKTITLQTKNTKYVLEVVE